MSSSARSGAGWSRNFRLTRVFVAAALIALIAGVASQPGARAAGGIQVTLEHWANGTQAWVNGNLNGHNSSYGEGDSVPNRLTIQGLAPNTTYQLDLSFQTSKKGIHATDYLTTYDASQLKATVDGNECAAGPGGAPGCDATDHQDHALPSIPPLDAEDGGTNEFVPGSISPQNFLGYGVSSLTVDPSYGPLTDCSGKPNGDYEATSCTSFSMMFTTAATSAFAAADNTVILFWGGHLAQGSGYSGAAGINDWLTDAGEYADGACAINGSPYHWIFEVTQTVGGVTNTIARGDRDRSVKCQNPTQNPGTIRLQKVCLPGNDPTAMFSFTGTPQGAVDLSTPLGCGDDRTATGDGSYTFTEILNPQWDLAHIVCDDANSFERGSDGGVPLSNLTTDAITVGDGDDITCTFTNRQAQMPVSKTIDGRSPTCTPDGHGGFTTPCTDVVIGSVPQFTLNLYPDIDPTDGQGVCGFPGGPGACVLPAPPFPPGTTVDTPLASIVIPPTADPQAPVNTPFTICEMNLPNGWTLPDDGVHFVKLPATPVVNDPLVYTPATGGGGDRCFDVLIPSGTTTFEIHVDNVPHGNIIVKKVTVPSPNTTDSFTFTGDAAGTIMDGQTIEVDNLAPGTYTSIENSASGFDLTSVVCNDANSTGNKTTRTASFNLEVGETVTCTFTNTSRTPDVSTTIKNKADDSAVTGALPLGSSVYDTTTVTGSNGPVTGTVNYLWFTNATCDGTTVAGVTAGTGVALNGKSDNEGPLGAGSYSFMAHFNGDANYNAKDGPCESLTINKANLTISTTLTKPGPLNLGDTNSDGGTLSGIVSGFTPTGSYAFTLYGPATSAFPSTGACTTAAGTAQGSGSIPANGSLTSTTTAALGAGYYAFGLTIANSTPTADPNYTYPIGPANCEPFKVNQAQLSISTVIHLGSTDSGTPIAITQTAVGATVHDSATVTGLLTSFPPSATNQVTFRWFTNASCNGTATATSSPYALTALDPALAETLSAAGGYSYQATVSGDSNYAGATAACEPLTVLPNGIVTNSSLCTFDVDSSLTGNQFRLIYTPDPTTIYWQLNASNPGQYYYNVFYAGAGNTTINLAIPGPFVTQGTVPVHVYSGVTSSVVSGQTCYVPGTEIENSNTTGAVTGVPIALGPIGSFKTVSVHLPPLAGGFAYINIHLDYGFKGSSNYGKDGSNNAVQGGTSTIVIPDKQSYAFSDTTGGHSTIQSENLFQADPGIAGLVTYAKNHTASCSACADQPGNPIAGAVIKITSTAISGGSVTLPATDVNGWYQWLYKYTGKATTFTVQWVSGPAGTSLVEGANPQTVTLKSNGFLIVNFTVK